MSSPMPPPFLFSLLHSPYPHQHCIFCLLSPLSSICASDPFTPHTRMNTALTPPPLHLSNCLNKMCFMIPMKSGHKRRDGPKEESWKVLPGRTADQEEASRLPTEEEESKEGIRGQLPLGMPFLRSSWRKHGPGKPPSCLCLLRHPSWESEPSSSPHG